MTAHRNDDVYRVGTFIFAGLALLLAFGALALAGVAWSRSNDTKDEVHKLAARGLLSKKLNVDLREFSMTVAPGSARAGNVIFDINNSGTITHEMVIVRAPSVESLPRVTTATTERAVGDIDEEAIPEADLPGEATVKAGGSKTVTIKLTPGTYTMICNIDTKSGGQTVSHFQQGMSTVFTVT